MANPMRNSDFRSVVEPVLNEVFDGIYDQRDDEYKQVFNERTGTPRNRHEEPVLAGLGQAPELPDGMPVTYRAGSTHFIKQYIYKIYGLAFALTPSLIEDGDHASLGPTYSEYLAQALIETKEVKCANVLNNSFNSSFPGGDGQALISTAHPIINGKTFSNQLAAAAALSQTSLEQMLITLRTNGVDNAGNYVNLPSDKLVVPPALEPQAIVLLNSTLRAGTVNNDVNPVKIGKMLSGGVAVLTRLTSSTAWWVTVDQKTVRKGLTVMVRSKVKKGMEGDFETGSMRYKATERYDVGFTDPRAAFGTPGL